MPNQPKTQHRSVRIPNGRWDKADHNTKIMGTNRAEVINQLLAWYNREPGARLPKRPDAAEPSD